MVASIVTAKQVAKMKSIQEGEPRSSLAEISATMASDP